MERLPTREIERFVAPAQRRQQRAWRTQQRTLGRICAAEAWARGDEDVAAELSPEPEPDDTS